MKALILTACLLCWPLSAAAQPVAPATVTPTNDWVDFYSYHLTFAGIPAPVGTYASAYDPQGTQCGERTTTTVGYLAPLMPCYGDDPKTPADEGAVDGNTLTFKVNGVAATAIARKQNGAPVSASTPIKWHSKDNWEIDLAMAAQPLLAITHTPGQSTLSWQAAAVGPATYEVWRSNRAYFDPTAGEGAKIETVPPNANPLAWSDTTGADDPNLNVTYRVLSKNSGGTLIGASQEVGEFDFGLTR